MTILVTGATGSVGSAVVHELRERDVDVRAFVRDVGQAKARLGDIECIAGDYADRASIDDALMGVDRVFLCSPNDPRQVQHEITVIDAAAAAGIGRLVKVGANGARVGSPLAFWDAHGQIERHLALVGVPAVVLHPSSYTSNLLVSAETIKTMGRLFAPAGEAKVTLIDPRDVAAAAAVALTEDGHDGRTYMLTGPEAVSYTQAAACVSAAIGKPVDYVDVPDGAARDGMLQAGLSPWLADQLVILWQQLRRGAAAETTDVVRVLTGREPRSVSDFVGDYTAAFQN